MSFFTKLGANVYKNSLHLLNSTCTLQQATTTLAIASSRSYHIMTNFRPSTLGINGLSSGIGGVTPATSAMNGIDKLLQPWTSLLTQVSGFKVKGRLKRRCKDCYFVMRQQRLYVICPTHRRHKQMAMKKREKNTWILTHATQSKVRPY
ncbi:uncharacterized protein mRpL36 [Eurosta solidaginis]|uniref:uncharacterized protein mRpL36 n=1 Tax=Eurosta solidaginis TaxID=178769 RepID=UPI0035315AE8